ncbi:phosphate ABC transporter substrate-binding protein, PhoT family [Halothece sp. PCC 7418]|uniref:PstS family phosphate ABC transporter substrate-binding protein n=1 Tax=Halothece sp. (strain PCC 7418) TaxID=65093 RepID=UPI0002A0642F|nr:PstS family phosphate ABC transporter substrate-binding protein [Halothece sp. PCC 7418]AFZ42297.1 phosphate ABC transporter substrate-binding protein, PhoT family [Halothece sp. PCC 7418]
MVVAKNKFSLKRFSIAGAVAFATATLGLAISEVRSQGNLVSIDGSSTVYPIQEGIAEEFQKDNRGYRVTVGVSGSGGGFEKFCRGETDISNASRPIKDSEAQRCAQNGIEFVELEVAFDGITVVVNPENNWVDTMTVEQLETIWEPDAQGNVTRWSDVNSSWPNVEMSLYGPGADSGTFDYFTEVIVGEEGASRGDYTASEDDNVLVTGVERDRNALAYFGYAYYVENQDTLKAVGIDNGNGAVKPNQETIESGKYAPLSRPLFVYVKKSAMEKPQVEAYVEYFLSADNITPIVNEIGYVPLSRRGYLNQKAKIR